MNLKDLIKDTLVEYSIDNDGEYTKLSSPLLQDLLSEELEERITGKKVPRKDGCKGWVTK